MLHPLVLKVLIFAALAAGGCGKSADAPNPVTTTPPSPSVPYHFDRAAYDARLAATQDAAARAGVLSERWSDILRIVAYTSVLDNPGFYQTLSKNPAWMQKLTSGSDRLIPSDLDQPLNLQGNLMCRIEGDCAADVRAEGSTVVHIWGDLSGSLTLGDDCEVVIGGDVTATGKISVLGACRVLTGGDFLGKLVGSGSLRMLWVHGSFSGHVETGAPFANIHVTGDFTGTVEPFEKASLLTVDVHGFMSTATVQEIIDHQYKEASFSIGRSDTPAGIYTGGSLGHFGQPTGDWVVHRQEVEAALR